MVIDIPEFRGEYPDPPIELARRRYAERLTDIAPSESDLNDESLDEQVDLHRYCSDELGHPCNEKWETNVAELYAAFEGGSCHCPSKRFDQHTGDDGCEKCGTAGAHHWITVCACCGNQQSRFEAAEYLGEE